MRKFYLFVFLLVAAVFVCQMQASAQTDTALPVSPQPVRQNAGFDVIIKTNGEILHGLVTEVGPILVYYKRTDIPDGPIYTVLRNELYAISYRNQVTDYLQPVNANPVPPVNSKHNPANGYYPNINYKKNILANGSVNLSLGFIRAFTKVDNPNNYTANGGAPVISLSYDVRVQNNVKAGLLVGFGSHKFSSGSYSSYDSTISNVDLKEAVFGIYGYGKYMILSNTSRLQPFITIGVGLATSHVTSETRIGFMNDDSKTLLIRSGARGASLNLMARAGAAYYFNKQFQLFADVGSGLALINLGLTVSVK